MKAKLGDKVPVTVTLWPEGEVDCEATVMSVDLAGEVVGIEVKHGKHWRAFWKGETGWKIRET